MRQFFIFIIVFMSFFCFSVFAVGVKCIAGDEDGGENSTEAGSASCISSAVSGDRNVNVGGVVANVTDSIEDSPANTDDPSSGAGSVQ